MATIDLILRAVNRATGPLKDIAAAADRTADRIDALNGKIERTDRAMAGLEGSARMAADRIDSLNGKVERVDRAMASLEGAARMAESGMRSAGHEADILTAKLSVLNGKLDDLDRTVTAKVKVDVDKSSLSRLEEQRSGGKGVLGNLTAIFAPGGKNSGAAFAALPLAAQGGIAAGAAAVLPFIAQMLSGGAIFGLGSGLAGLGIAGALTTGTAPKAPSANAVATAKLRLQAAQQRLAQLMGGSSASPSQIAAAQASLLGAQGRLGGLGAPRPVAPGAQQSDQLRVTSAQDRLTSALDRLAKLQAPGSKASPASIASAQASIAAAQASVVAAQGRLAGLGTPRPVAPGALGAGQLRVTSAQDRLNSLLAGHQASPAQISSARSSVLSAQDQLTKVQQQQAAYNDFQQTYKLQLKAKAAFANLSSDAQNSLAQIGKSFVPVMISVFNTADSTLKKLTPVFAGAVKTISGPFKVFADTLVSSFSSPQVKTSIGAVATAFGKLLKALTPGLPGDVNEIATGITKIADAVAKNPGAFAAFINDLFKIAQVALSVIADLTNTATYIEAHFRPALHRVAVIFDGVRHEVAHIWDDMMSSLIRTYGAFWNDTIGSTIRFGHDWESYFNTLRHNISAHFDEIRHDISHIWDLTWHNTVDRLNNGVNDSNRLLGVLQHNISAHFDEIRHNVSSVWDEVWNNTVGRTERGVSDVIHWTGTLPGRVEGAFKGARTWLYGAGKDVIQGFWNGLTYVWDKVAGWISGLANWIKQHKGPVSLDQQLLYPAGRALMTGLKVGLQHGFVDIKDIITGAASDIGSWIMHGGNKLLGFGLSALHGLTGTAKSIWDSLFGGGSAGGGVSQWAGIVLRALSMEHLNTGLLGNVLYQMQTESGGNPHAINLSDFNATVLHDPSRGLMQVIGSTFAAFHWPGTSSNIYDPLANVAAALNYARLRYGPTLMTGGMGIGSGHGYASGGIIPEPVLGIGMRSGSPYTFGENGPETVVPGAGHGRGGHGGPLIHIGEMHVHDESDVTMVAQRLSGMIRAASLGGGFR